MLFDERQPLIALGQALVFNKLSKEDVASDGAQSEGDRVKNQPEYDFFCLYFGPAFLFGELDESSIS